MWLTSSSRLAANIYVELASSQFVALVSLSDGKIKKAEVIRNTNGIDAEKALLNFAPDLNEKSIIKREKKSSRAIVMIGKKGLNTSIYWIIDNKIHCAELGEIKVTDINKFVEGLKK